MQKITIDIKGMSCMGCVKSVKAALEAVEGVKSVDVSLEAANATVELEDGFDVKTLEEAIEEAGFEASAG